MSTIRCQICEEGGVFTETFKRTDGWQGRVRGWVSDIRGRFGIKDGSKLNMFSSTNGITFKLARSIAL